MFSQVATAGGRSRTNVDAAVPGIGKEESRRIAEVAQLAAAGAAAARSQLVLRFALFNLAGFALLGAAWGQGWVGHIVAADTTFISAGIFAVFLGGLAACAREVWRISAELDAVQADRPAPGSMTHGYLARLAGRDAGSRAILAGALRMKLTGRITTVRYVANMLVLLGLVGTVIGFVIALSAVDAETVGNVDAIAPMVARLLDGMAVALYTTLVGTVLHLWLGANQHLLSTGAARLAARLIERGERHA